LLRFFFFLSVEALTALAGACLEGVLAMVEMEEGFVTLLLNRIDRFYEIVWMSLDLSAAPTF
jgi:hypothetical protein